MGVAMTLEEQKKAARGSAFARRKIAFGAQNEVTCEVLSEVLAAYRMIITEDRILKVKD